LWQAIFWRIWDRSRNDGIYTARIQTIRIYRAIKYCSFFYLFL
jgi:hypothetical protein